MKNRKIQTLGCSSTETDNRDLREGSPYTSTTVYYGKYGLWVVVAQ
jgi:hypothetical protein